MVCAQTLSKHVTQWALRVYFLEFCFITPMFSRRLLSASRRYAALARPNVTRARLATTAATPASSSTPTAAKPASEFKVTSEIPPPSSEAFAETPNDGQTDWSKSYSGLSQEAFAKEIAQVLLSPLDPLDIEMKPGAVAQNYNGCRLLTYLLPTQRRSDIPSGDQVSTDTEQGLWSWRLGSCTAQ